VIYECPPSDTPIRQADVSQYCDATHGMVELVEAARRTSARAVNSLMTRTYWEIGRRIVERKQYGAERALRRGADPASVG